MFFQTAIPIIGLLSLVAAAFLLVLAMFPGNRMRRLKLSGATFLVSVLCIVAFERSYDPQAPKSTEQESEPSVGWWTDQETAPIGEAPSREDPHQQKFKVQIEVLRLFDTKVFTKDVASIMLAVELFAEASRTIESVQNAPLSDDMRKLATQLQSLLISKQKVALPILRDAYGPALRKALWEEDGSAKTFGAGFRTIDIVHPAFAANRNIKSFHRDTATVLAKLRFTRVNYKWIKNPTEFSYFSLEPPKDSELVIWRENGRFVRLKPIAEGG